jgi:hypothetical protein
LQWTITGAESTIDHYVAYISTDGKNLMSLGNVNTGLTSVNLCSYSVPNGSYTFYVQAVGKPSMSNQISGAVKLTSTCTVVTTTDPGTVSLGTSPSSMTIQSGGAGNLTVTATPESGAFNDAIALTCSGLPKGLTCSFSPASITPGAVAVDSVLTVSAASSSTAENHRERSHPLLATWMFSFGLVGLTLIGKVQRKRIFAILGACIVAAMIVGASSCGGGTGVNAASSSPTSPTSPSSPSGSAASYTVTINGSASSVQLATTVTVTVK